MKKAELYEMMNAQLCALLDGESDVIANLANASSLIWQNLEQINWAGFYLYKEKELMLGPFQGKPACMHIPMGKGVCGSSASQGKILRIDDVHLFPGHIACDSASSSEIVLPIYKDGNLLGVLDIDSPILSRFDEEDEVGLTLFVQHLENTLA